MRIKSLIVLICLGLLSGTANADTVTLSGHFNDPANTALRNTYFDAVSGDPYLGPALFINDYDYATNVAIYGLSVTSDGAVTFSSKGYTGVGADPYVSIFLGSDFGATFPMSIFNLSGPGDFIYTEPMMSAGNYMIAICVYENMSFAENYGTGTLGDGFTIISGPGSLGNPLSVYYAYYELEVTGPVQSVPEPGTFWLILTGFAGLIKTRKRFV